MGRGRRGTMQDTTFTSSHVERGPRGTRTLPLHHAMWEGAAEVPGHYLCIMPCWRGPQRYQCSQSHDQVSTFWDRFPYTSSFILLPSFLHPHPTSLLSPGVITISRHPWELHSNGSTYSSSSSIEYAVSNNT